MDSVSTTVADENTRYEEMMNNVQQALEALEKSSFFAEFMKQMQDPEIVAQIVRVTEHSKLQVVLYGVGNIERAREVEDCHVHTREVEVCHLQLAFANLYEILREMLHSEPEICEQSANLYERPYVYVKAFSEISWHFFPSDGSLEDLNLNLFPEDVEDSHRLDLIYLRC